MLLLKVMRLVLGLLVCSLVASLPSYEKSSQEAQKDLLWKVVHGGPHHAYRWDLPKVPLPAGIRRLSPWTSKVFCPDSNGPGSKVIIQWDILAFAVNNNNKVNCDHDSNCRAAIPSMTKYFVDWSARVDWDDPSGEYIIFLTFQNAFWLRLRKKNVRREIVRRTNCLQKDGQMMYCYDWDRDLEPDLSHCKLTAP